MRNNYQFLKHKRIVRTNHDLMNRAFSLIINESVFNATRAFVNEDAEIGALAIVYNYIARE